MTNPGASNRSGIVTTSRVVSCCSAVSRRLGPVFMARRVSVSVLPLEARTVTRRISGGRGIGSFVVVFRCPGTRLKWLCLDGGN
jgi:hypothetical protein